MLGFPYLRYGGQAVIGGVYSEHYIPGCKNPWPSQGERIIPSVHPQASPKRLQNVDKRDHAKVLYFTWMKCIIGDLLLKTQKSKEDA